MIGVVVFTSDIYCVLKDELKDISLIFVIFLNSIVIELEHLLNDLYIYFILCF